MDFQQAIPTIVVAIIGGLLGIIVKGLASEIKSMHSDMKEMVSKEVCEAHRETISKDINNLGQLVRNKNS